MSRQRAQATVDQSYGRQLSRIEYLTQSTPDVKHFLDRIERLLRDGEYSESIILRLQPPARIAPLPSQFGSCDPDPR